MCLCFSCSLEGSDFLIPDPAALRGLKLTGLVWHNGKFNDAWLETLGALSLPLTATSLYCCEGVSGAALGRLRTLQSLTVVQYGHQGNMGLDDVCYLPLLTSLRLFGMRTFTGLEALRRATRLESLSLESCRQVWAWSSRLEVGHVFVHFIYTV